MKTSEFVSYVDKNWFATWKNGDNVIEIVGVMKVHTNCQLIEFDEKTATTSSHFRLIEKAIEYTETPLEEREEEKKYLLKSKLFEFGTEGHLYLINSTIHKQYCLGLNIRQSFTQKEIDAMPFDTGFFVKEKV